MDFIFSPLTEPEHHLAVSGRTTEPGLGRQLQPHPERRQGNPTVCVKGQICLKGQICAKS